MLLHITINCHYRGKFCFLNVKYRPLVVTMETAITDAINKAWEQLPINAEVQTKEREQPVDPQQDQQEPLHLGLWHQRSQYRPVPAHQLYR